MSITTVLFDLDGTLLPMDQDIFVQAYLEGLVKKAVPYGYDGKALARMIWAGTGAMVQNDGQCLNKDVFWKLFADTFGPEKCKDEALFEAFYKKEFQEIQAVCGFQPKAASLIAMLKEQGLSLVLATNPLFPQIATYSRVRWAGLSPEDFTYITTYENSRYCKPNLQYYREILQTIGTSPEECLMVGNDVAEDMIAQTLGMQVFLLTDCLINKPGKDLSAYPHGDFDALTDFLVGACPDSFASRK